MITEQIRGKILFEEVYTDFKKNIEKKLKKEREILKKPYQKEKKNINNWLYKITSIKSPRLNQWYIKTGMIGDREKPKLDLYYHCNTNAGKDGSKLYVMLRGNKYSKEDPNSKGYIVSVTSHVLKRMRERAKSDFGEFQNNDELCTKIFTLGEEGILYLYDWTKHINLDTTPSYEKLEQISRPGWMKRNQNLGKPGILKTLSGIYLCFRSDDGKEVYLKTYITEKELTEEEEEKYTNIIKPAWILFNRAMFDENIVKETENNLRSYMRTHSNEEVYRLRR